MEKQEYTMYEIITMTPGMAGEVLVDEINKENPDLELVKNLIQHSWIEDVNLRTEWCRTALILASSWGHTEIATLLLERPEIMVNVQDFFRLTALMYASANGHTEIVKGLLGSPEIDVNLENKRGETALMYASANGHTEIADLIRSHPNYEDIDYEDY